MCFTPIISLSVAIIEFILATILILFFKRTTLRNCVEPELGLHIFTEAYREYKTLL